MDGNEVRNDLLQFIATTVETMRDQMATKVDLRKLEERMDTIEGRMGTLEGGMATKSDLRRLEERLEARMEAGFTAVRGDIERVSLRLDTIERALSARLSQIETDMSRLRSVLYLLVKDQPELLRLLGSEPPLV